MLRPIRLAAIVLVGLLALVTRGSLAAQSQSTPAPPPTLQQLEPAPPRQADQMSRRDENRTATSRALSERRTQCLRAFGHAAFCGCLSDQLPTDVTFLTYIQVVAASRQDLGYARLAKEDQKSVDLISTARDGCVAKTMGQ
jgi:hypothetical protein